MANNLAELWSSEVLAPKAGGQTSFAGIFQTHFNEAAEGKYLSLKAVSLQKGWTSRFSLPEIYELVIPARTLARRIVRKEKLTQTETDKALRLARIATEADRVFANTEKANKWLRTPLTRLANQTPLSLLKTETGALVVDQILGQIDHGIFV